VAAEAERLKAERLFVEAGYTCGEIAAALSIPRRTVYGWRDKGDWEIKRSELSHKSAHGRTEAALECNRSEAAANVGTHLERRAILAACYRDSEVEWRDRIAAIKLDAALDPATSEGALDGTSRFVIVDPGNA